MIDIILGLACMTYIIVWITKAYNINIRKLLVREWPVLIAFVLGVAVYVAVATAERADPIQLNYPDGRVVYIESPPKKVVPIHRLFLEAVVVVAVVLTVIRAGIQYVINKPGDVEERTDNTASGSDYTEEFFNVKSADSLCPAPSGDNTVDEMTLKEENVIVMTHKKWYVIFLCGLLFLPLIFEIDALSVLLSILGILTLFLSFNHKIILNDIGIITENKFFDYYKKSTFLSWSAITEVRYIGAGGLKLLPTSFLFVSKENNSVIIEKFLYKNYEESLRYAVGKLPESKFQGEARDKLKIMGIWQ
jgi:hypothetical protein